MRRTLTQQPRVPHSYNTATDVQVRHEHAGAPAGAHVEPGNNRPLRTPLLVSHDINGRLFVSTDPILTVADNMNTRMSRVHEHKHDVESKCDSDSDSSLSP
jgi:hypothetical protein